MRAPTSRSERLAISTSFVLAIALGTVLFLRARDPQRTVPDPRTSPAAAAQAHEAAGIQIGAVAPAFQQRLHDAQAKLAQDSTNVQYVRDLAHLYDDGHRPAEAISLYRRAIALAPDEATTHFDLASAFVKLQDFPAATSVLEAWLDRHPADPQALFNLGAVRANAGDVPGAQSWFQRAIDASSDPALIERAQAAVERLSSLREPS